MGQVVDREKPFYFSKSATALRQSGDAIPYPPGTTNYHFEFELVIALGAPAFKIAAAGRARGRVRLCLRPRHDAPRSATLGTREAAALDARQGRRRQRADLADHAGFPHRPSRPRGHQAQPERDAATDLRHQPDGLVGARNHLAVVYKLESSMFLKKNQNLLN